MMFVCEHGRRDGQICWDCRGYAIVSTVRDFDDRDILRFVRPRLRATAQASLLDRLDRKHKAALLMSLTWR